jgi:hypothetical protein
MHPRHDSARIERVIGTIRQECLDKTIMFNERGQHFDGLSPTR